ncbi:hypothetical protein [Streptomyces sp. AP-93]|uniref:hypothetical protein n=1 Tax=Streptomyces sp. AP-93 TaxID=2929048 RepID=UPI001FAEA0FF|nr:hypothetical protein [Streptomyces sp. AP-93]MCJ0868075.1 hypothetical protein [Streptomyces sp. AP-93]
MIIAAACVTGLFVITAACITARATIRAARLNATPNASQLGAHQENMPAFYEISGKAVVNQINNVEKGAAGVFNGPVTFN